MADVILYYKRNLADDDNEFLGLNSDPTRRENEFEIRYAFILLFMTIISRFICLIYVLCRCIQRRKKLLYELNSTGKYFAFKEQLKNSVIKIVREKFFKTSALNDPEEFQVKFFDFTLEKKETQFMWFP